MTDARVQKAWRVWAALVAAPLCLAVAFGSAAGFLVVARGVSADQLPQALPPVAPWAGLVGFAAMFFVTHRLARADGLTLAALGWRRPSGIDLAIGVAVAALVAVADASVFYPLVQRAQPSFDPQQAAIPLPALALMLGAGVIAEDTLYRGYAFEVLRARRGLPFTVVVTSLAYALLAPGPEWPLKLWAFGFGVVLVTLRAWRGSLWPVVIVHATAALVARVWASLSG